VDFAIIEGFKQYPYPKIVIGDLAIEKCILKNPSVGEVIDSLDLFEIYQMKL
jgi:molybdopterin-guanine dinucleotide biosynthesis protein